jgi:lauroyl/myristoyl acyltransferase
MAAGQNPYNNKPEPLGLGGKLLQALFSIFLFAVAKLCAWIGPDRMARIGGHPLTPLLFVWILRYGLRRRTPLRTDANMKLVFPHLSDTDRGAIKQNYYGNVLRSFATTVSVEADEQLFSRISVSGLEHLQGSEKGIIFVGCHFFDWEIAFVNLFQIGYPSYTLYRDFSENLLNYRKFIRCSKIVPPAYYIPSWRSRELIEHSKKGRHLFLLLDFRVKDAKNGELIDFCGHPAWTSTFAARLALAHDKALIPVFFRHDGHGGYQHSFEAPIDCSSGDPVEITRLINASISRQIVAHPEQWALWDGVRWKP